MREVGSDPQCNNWQRGDCGSGGDYEQEENKYDFMAQKLPYRRDSGVLRLPATTRNYSMGTDFSPLFLSAFWSRSRSIKGIAYMMRDSCSGE